MGSKTLENEGHQQQDGPTPNDNYSLGGEPRGNHLTRDGDGCVGSNGGAGESNGDADDDGDDNAATAAAAVTATDPPESTDPGQQEKKKKINKKRKRSKKKGKAGAAQKQSSPPRVPLDELFPRGDFPPGELLDYGAPAETTARFKTTEMRHTNRLDDEALLRDYRKAAEVHRQTRKWVHDTVKPGHTLAEIAVGIEDSVRALLGNQGLETGHGLKSGFGFPTGLAVNECVAHYTPNPGHKDIVLRREDVVKVDFGVHVNGWIVDSAFTLSFDPVYDNLLSAVKDATNTGIKNAGVDVRISDVSAAIQETMESYEVEIGGKTYPVKPVRDLCGHDIKPYRIHGSKTIPFIRNNSQVKMEAGDVFAIETFGSTGRGRTRPAAGVYGYELVDHAPKQVSLPFASANRLYKTIRDNFGTLVFCRRYLERLGCDRYLAGLNSLVSHGILEEHAPLMDIQGSYSAQFEHTILLRESQKEVISRGDDY